MSQVIRVDMAGFNIAKPPGALSTMGIGSCVAVCLYDPNSRLGGLAHIMLPHNTVNDSVVCGRYADTGIDALIRLMCRNGASQSGLVAKIVGGASMFTSQQHAVITVGKRNAESVKAILADRNIHIMADDTGGRFGRAVVFYPETGAAEVTILSAPPKRVLL